MFAATSCTGSVNSTCTKASVGTPSSLSRGLRRAVMTSGAAPAIGCVFSAVPAVTRKVYSIATGAPPSGLTAVAVTV
jgi:hypothetical protein